MSARFEIRATALAGLSTIRRLPVLDERGWLERAFCAREFAAAGMAKAIVQINRSLTRRRATVRGLHFQYPPHAEVRIVSCLRGEVFDVAVDLRAGSPTFLRWHGEILSAGNHTGLLIPEGFAHGFQTLTEDCEMLYFHTGEYTPAAEGGVHPCDRRVGVSWPLPVSETSERDAGFAPLTEAFRGVAP